MTNLHHIMSCHLTQKGSRFSGYLPLMSRLWRSIFDVVEKVCYCVSMTSMCPNMSKPDLTFLNLEHRWTGSKAAGTFTWLNLWKKVGHIDLVTTIELYCYYHHYSCMYVAQLILLVKYFMFLTNQLIFEVNNTRWRCFLLGCNWSRDLLA